MAALPAKGEQKVEMDVMEMPPLDNGATTLERFSQRERAEVDEYLKILEGQKLPFDIYHLPFNKNTQDVDRSGLGKINPVRYLI